MKPRPSLLARFRSLRWRLTFLYLALLSVLLLLLGVGQYFVAREVLFRSNADVLANDYKAVATTFLRAQLAARPRALPLTAAASATRTRQVLIALARELSSRQISAAIYDVDGAYVTFQPSSLAPDTPAIALAPSDYVAAIRRGPRPYYMVSAGDPPATYLTVLRVIQPGARPIGIAQLSVSTADIDRTLALDREFALIGSLIVLLLALGLSPLIIGRALKPLEHMAVTANAIAAGDYTQRVAVPPTHDEIGQLGVAFNQMAAGVDQAFEVRRQSEDRMRQFVADASHELRTPLTSIAGYIDVLARRDSVDASTLHAALDAMRRESARMTRLVGDLLTLTRFESGRVPAVRPIALDSWLKETLDELHLPDQGSPERRALQGGIVVKADPDALKQVVINLAQNAVKYAPGAEQDWSCFAADGRAAIRVHDAGPGIPAADLPHIFERFYRGEKARDRSTGGSGLGLAIARSIVEAHSGVIQVESRPGEGATFTAWLPLAA
ncbi:MAG TPA: ATP-binding protein [Candidatus Limnocylindrales bacterium]|nr:ATP-binding protein [Candidatus Limnocylindrales bacterium]